MFRRLETALVAGAHALVVAMVLMVALQAVVLPSVPGGGGAVCLVGVPLWALGRFSWSRRHAPVREERLKPRRRALPPAPMAGDEDVALPQIRPDRRTP
ncbi:MAG TPA: hypothetical protein VFQ35_02765 [Polyangiaceae bacterium]|nr:hypothetical protein [Polyangiaceae bacterium]